MGVRVRGHDVRTVGRNQPQQGEKKTIPYLEQTLKLVRVLPVVSVSAHVHHNMSVVRLALVHLRGGVLLTGKLSGAAQ